MSKNNLKYTLLIGGPLLALSLIILFGPGSEEDNKDSILWEKSFAAIEYVPAPPGAEEKKTVQPTPKKGKGKPPAKAGTLDGKVPFRFERVDGMFKDEFWAQSPGGGLVGNPNVRRKGGKTVKNIFTEWSRPKLKAHYKVPVEKLARMGIGKNSIRLKLYEKAGGQPIVITFGDKTKSNNIFFTTSLPDHKGNVFMVAGYVKDKFKLAYSAYRDKGLFQNKAGDYTAKLNVKFFKSGKSLNLSQTKLPRTTKTKQRYAWMDQEGKMVPTQQAAALDKSGKNMQIYAFQDDHRLSKTDDSKKLWESAKDTEIYIKGETTEGNLFELRIRLPQDIKIQSRPMALVQIAGGDYIDFVEKRNYDNIIRHMNMVEQFKKRRALQEKMKQQKKGKKGNRPPQNFSPSSGRKPPPKGK